MYKFKNKVKTTLKFLAASLFYCCSSACTENGTMNRMKVSDTSSNIIIKLNKLSTKIKSLTIEVNLPKKEKTKQTDLNICYIHNTQVIDQNDFDFLRVLTEKLNNGSCKTLEKLTLHLDSLQLDEHPHLNEKLKKEIKKLLQSIKEHNQIQELNLDFPKELYGSLEQTIIDVVKDKKNMKFKLYAKKYTDESTPNWYLTKEETASEPIWNIAIKGRIDEERIKEISDFNEKLRKYKEIFFGLSILATSKCNKMNIKNNLEIEYQFLETLTEIIQLNKLRSLEFYLAQNCKLKNNIKLDNILNAINNNNTIETVKIRSLGDMFDITLCYRLVEILNKNKQLKQICIKSLFSADSNEYYCTFNIDKQQISLLSDMTYELGNIIKKFLSTKTNHPYKLKISTDDGTLDFNWLNCLSQSLQTTSHNIESIELDLNKFTKKSTDFEVKIQFFFESLYKNETIKCLTINSKDYNHKYFLNNLFEMLNNNNSITHIKIYNSQKSQDYWTNYNGPTYHIKEFFPFIKNRYYEKKVSTYIDYDNKDVSKAYNEFLKTKDYSDLAQFIQADYRTSFLDFFFKNHPEETFNMINYTNYDGHSLLFYYYNNIEVFYEILKLGYMPKEDIYPKNADEKLEITLNIKDKQSVHTSPVNEFNSFCINLLLNMQQTKQVHEVNLLHDFYKCVNDIANEKICLKNLTCFYTNRRFLTGNKIDNDNISIIELCKSIEKNIKERFRVGQNVNKETYPYLESEEITFKNLMARVILHITDLTSSEHNTKYTFIETMIYNYFQQRNEKAIKFIDDNMKKKDCSESEIRQYLNEIKKEEYSEILKDITGHDLPQIIEFENLNTLIGHFYIASTDKGGAKVCMHGHVTQIIAALSSIDPFFNDKYANTNPYKLGTEPIFKINHSNQDDYKKILTNITEEIIESTITKIKEIYNNSDENFKEELYDFTFSKNKNIPSIIIPLNKALDKKIDNRKTIPSYEYYYKLIKILTDKLELYYYREEGFDYPKRIIKKMEENAKKNQEASKKIAEMLRTQKAKQAVYDIMDNILNHIEVKEILNDVLNQIPQNENDEDDNNYLSPIKQETFEFKLPQLNFNGNYLETDFEDRYYEINPDNRRHSKLDPDNRHSKEDRDDERPFL